MSSIPNTVSTRRLRMRAHTLKQQLDSPTESVRCGALADIEVFLIGSALAKALFVETQAHDR
jgi:hypothetical protein